MGNDAQKELRLTYPHKNDIMEISETCNDNQDTKNLLNDPVWSIQRDPYTDHGRQPVLRDEISPWAIEEIQKFEKLARCYFRRTGQEYLCKNFTTMSDSERKKSLANAMFL